MRFGINVPVRYKRLRYDVIYIEHILPGLLGKLAGFSVRGTEGAQLYDGVKIISDLRFEKNKSDSFTSDTFRAHMEKQGYTEVVLCGIDECGCVGATAEGAARRGLKVVMLSSAIGSRFPNSKIEKRRHSLKALGVDYIG